MLTSIKTGFFSLFRSLLSQSCASPIAVRTSAWPATFASTVPAVRIRISSTRLSPTPDTNPRPWERSGQDTIPTFRPSTGLIRYKLFNNVFWFYNCKVDLKLPQLITSQYDRFCSPNYELNLSNLFFDITNQSNIVSQSLATLKKTLSQISIGLK
jgi:hypothetical protein